MKHDKVQVSLLPFREIQARGGDNTCLGPLTDHLESVLQMTLREKMALFTGFLGMARAMS